MSQDENKGVVRRIEVGGCEDAHKKGFRGRTNGRKIGQEVYHRTHRHSHCKCLFGSRCLSSSVWRDVGRHRTSTMTAVPTSESRNRWVGVSASLLNLLPRPTAAMVPLGQLTAGHDPRIFQECMRLTICLVGVALSHGDGVVALLRVEVGVPARQRCIFLRAWIRWAKGQLTCSRPKRRRRSRQGREERSRGPAGRGA